MQIKFYRNSFVSLFACSSFVWIEYLCNQFNQRVRKKWCVIKQMVFWCQIDTLNVFQLLCISVIFCYSFFLLFDFVLAHQFCIMQRDISMLLLLCFDIANSFSIHFHLISRIDSIVCMLWWHYHNTYSHWQFHFHTRTFTCSHVHIQPKKLKYTTKPKNTVRCDGQSIMEHVWMEQSKENKNIQSLKVVLVTSKSTKDVHSIPYILKNHDIHIHTNAFTLTAFYL